MSIKSGQLCSAQFTTAGATGALADADALPTGTLVVNAANNAAVVTVANVSTGVYSWSVTLPTLSAGDIAQVRIAATIGGIATGGVVWTEATDTMRSSDLPAEILSQPATLAVAGIVNGTLNIMRDVTFTDTLTGITFPLLWTRCYLSIKGDLLDADALSYVQLAVSKVPDAISDGLLYIERAAYTPHTDGSLTADEDAGTLGIVIADEATALLSRRSGLVMGVKFIMSDGTSSEPYTGTCSIGLAATRSLT